MPAFVRIRFYALNFRAEHTLASSFVEELLDDLEVESIVTKGTDGFADIMPPSDEVSGTVVACYDEGGIGDNYSPRANVKISWRVRAADYLTARQKAEQIYNRYHQMVDKTLENTRILSATGVLPRSLGRDDRNQNLVGFHIIYDIHLADQTLASGQEETGYGGKKDPLPNA